MARLLITTVGTSLLTNRDSRPWAGWNRFTGSLPCADDVVRWLTSANPVDATAETIPCVLWASTKPTVFDFCTPIPGKVGSVPNVCNDSIALVSCRAAALMATPLKALGYGGPTFAQLGLKALVDQAIIAVRYAREKSLEPVFCATGGFKAEIAFLNLMGALLEVEVYYIHEQFREIVRLPRLPLAWNADLVLQRSDFFEWIDGDLRQRSDVESWLKANPELQPLIEHATDGTSYLNAAGDLLFRAAKEVGPRATWSDAVAVPPGKKNGVSGVGHHRPPGWDRFVDRLCMLDCVCRVRYSKDACSGDAVHVHDGKAGVIAVRYGPPGMLLPLLVETTARGNAQTGLVRDYIAGLRD